MMSVVCPVSGLWHERGDLVTVQIVGSNVAPTPKAPAAAVELPMAGWADGCDLCGPGPSPNHRSNYLWAVHSRTRAGVDNAMPIR